jgi:lysozyme family protein
MADFLIAFNRTEKNEGKDIWTKVDGDSGGETWSGISRKANPSWSGWKILDQIKNKKNGQKISTPELEERKQSLYRTNYWNTIWGDEIKNQKVANDLYDTGVNMGPSTSIKLSERQFGMKETGRMSDELLNKLNSVV